jgi:hypothetical protein
VDGDAPHHQRRWGGQDPYPLILLDF